MEFIFILFVVVFFVLFILFRIYIYFLKEEESYNPKILKRRIISNADGDDFLKEISKKAGLFVIKGKAKGSYNGIDIKASYKYIDNGNIYTITINPSGEYKINMGLVYIEDKSMDKIISIKTFKGNSRNVISVFNKKIRNQILRINKYFEIYIHNNLIEINTKDKSLFLNTENLNELLDISEKILDKNVDTDKLFITIILNDTNIKVKRNCMKELVKYVDLNKYRASIKSIMNGMKDKDPLISIMAASILKEEGINHCLDIFMNNKDSEVIFYAIKFLKNYIHMDRVLKTFHKALNFLDDNHIPDIINVIYKIETKSNIKALLEYLIQNNYLSIYLKIKCIDFFGKNNIRESKEWVLSQVYNYDSNVAIAALNALKIIGDINCIEKLNKFRKSTYNKILKKLTDKIIKYIQKNVPENLKGNLQITDSNEYGELSIYNEKGELSVIENVKE